ncbi:ABC transporter permease [Cellulomonas sp. KRMCY2]|uniref:ABC transporter permease n=1 Tax=Cellulomonas sp. KRMCY2 TaxID=1304865 RepID=UPI00045EA3F1|nr:ABC transporter permease [Cellulomonas sp. KRMCY2]
MRTRSVVWMVAWREIKTRMLTKANIISMAVMLLLIVVGSVVGNYFLTRDSAPPTRHIAVEQALSGLEPHLVTAAAEQEIDLEITTMTAAEAEQALAPDDGESTLDAFLTGDPAAPTMVVASETRADVLAVVSAAVRTYVITDQIGALGGDPGNFEQAMAGAVPQVEPLEQPDMGRFDGPAYGVSMVMISLLLFALISSGSVIAMGVVEEKTSRVVEILLSTIKPTQLLAGKILGIGIFGMFQIVVLGGAMALALVALGLTDDLEMNLGAALIMLIVWFLIGYAIFALLFGGFAALVSRQEDIGSVTTPLMFMLFVPFYTTMFLVPEDPNGSVVRVLSQIPLFAPFMMPVRDAFGGLLGWELALSVVIALATIPVLIWVAARVYQRGVLHTGGRMKLAEALKG